MNKYETGIRYRKSGAGFDSTGKAVLSGNVITINRGAYLSGAHLVDGSGAVVLHGGLLQDAAVSNGGYILISGGADGVDIKGGNPGPVSSPTISKLEYEYVESGSDFILELVSSSTVSALTSGIYTAVTSVAVKHTSRGITLYDNYLPGDNFSPDYDFVLVSGTLADENGTGLNNYITSYTADGNAADAVGASAGAVTIAPGGVAKGITISSGGVLVVSKGGVAVVSGFTYGHGVIAVQPGGYVLHTDPPMQGCYLLSEGALVSTTFSGGTLGSDYELFVYSGGGVSGASVLHGAVLSIDSGGCASNVYINSNGSCIVGRGAVLSGASIDGNGLIYIYPGGSAFAVEFSEGYANNRIAGGGAVSADFVNQRSGCLIYKVDDSIVFYGDVNGQDGDTRKELKDLDTLHVRNSARAYNLDLAENVSVTVSSGGTMFDARMAAYYTVTTQTLDVIDVIGAKGPSQIISLGEVSGAVDNDGYHTTVVIQSGGLLLRPRVMAGSVALLPGASATSVSEINYGTVDVASGAIATSVRVQEGGLFRVGGYASVVSMGISASGMVLSGGSIDDISNVGGLLTLSGGIVSGVSVLYNAQVDISSGSVVDAVFDSSIITASSGASLTNAAVNRDAWLYAASGASISDITVNAGGGLVAQPGCIVTGDVEISSDGYFGGFYWGHAGYVIPDLASSITVLPAVTVCESSLTASAGAAVPVLSVVYPGSAHILAGASVVSAVLADQGRMYLSAGASVGSLKLDGGYLGIVQEDSAVEVSHIAGSIGNMFVTSDNSPEFTVVAGGEVGSLRLDAGKFYVSGGDVRNVMENEGYFAVISGEEPDYIKHTQHYPEFTGKSATAHSNTSVVHPVISAKGLLEIYSGGFASDVKVSRGGSLYLHSGTWVRKIHEKGGFVSALEPGALDGALFDSTPVNRLIIGVNRSCTVHSGTTFTAARVSKYGSVFVYDGGLFTAEMSPAGEYVMRSAVVSGIRASVFVSGGTMAHTEISGSGGVSISGGLMRNCTVGAEGTVTAESGALLRHINIVSGSVGVGSGASATDNGISAGYMTIGSGGYAYNNKVSIGGVLTVESGGYALAQQLASGAITVSSGGSVYGAVLHEATGNLTVSGGGIVEYLMLNTSGTGVITVEAGGTLTVAQNPWRPQFSEDLAALISDGGLIISSAEAIISLTSAGAWLGNQTSGVVAGGNPLHDLTSDNGLAVANGLSAVVSSGGEIISAEIYQQGKMTVYDGGSASAISAADSGELHISGYASSRYAAGSCWWYALLSGGAISTVLMSSSIISGNDSGTSGNNWQWTLHGTAALITSAAEFSITSTVGSFDASNGSSSVSTSSAVLLTISSGGTVTTIAPPYYEVDEAGHSAGFASKSGRSVVSSAVSSSTVSSFTETYIPGTSDVYEERIDPDTGSTYLEYVRTDTGTWAVTSTALVSYTMSLGTPQRGEDAPLGDLLLYHSGLLYRSALVEGGTIYSGLVVGGDIINIGYPILSNCVLSRTPVEITSAVVQEDTSSDFHIGYMPISVDIPTLPTAPDWGYLLYPGAVVYSNFAGMDDRIWTVSRLMHHPNGSHIVRSGARYSGGSMLFSHGGYFSLETASFDNLITTSTVFVDGESPHYERITYIPVTRGNGVYTLNGSYRLAYADHPSVQETCRMSGVEVLNNGEVFVSAGVVQDMMIRSGGSGCVDECGTVLNVTVNSGGTLYLGYTGSATVAFNPWSGSVVSSNGAYYSVLPPTLVYLGGIAGLRSSGTYMSGITVDRTEELLVYSNGAVDDIVVNGVLDVASGGTATVAFNPWSGSVVASEGAVVRALDRDHLIYIGGSLYGLVSKVDYLEREYTITGKHVVLVYSGGSIVEPTLSEGTLGALSGGKIFDPFISAYGKVAVYSSGFAEGPRVFSSGRLYVMSGGTASAVFLNGGTVLNESGGYVEISYNPWGSAAYEGGPDHRILGSYSGEGTVVYPDDRMACYYGCPEDGVVSRAEDALYCLNFRDADIREPRSALIYSGGSLVRTVVNNSGLALIDSSGLAFRTTLRGSGVLNVSGGLAESVTVSKTGSFSASAGGVVSNVVMYPDDSGNAHASGVLYSGGTADLVVLSGARLTIESGGTAKRVINSSGAIVYVSNGGYMDNFHVSSGASVFISPGAITVSGALLYEGRMDVSSGGTALQVKWNPGVGQLNHDIGALVTFADDVTGVYICSAGSQLAAVYTYSGILGGGSYAYAMPRGLMLSCTISSGRAYIWSGGSAYGVIAEYGENGGVELEQAAMLVYSGGRIESTRISHGGVWVYSGGSVVDTLISGVGKLTLLSGCTGGACLVEIGTYDVSSGASAVDALLSGGQLRISEAAAAVDPVVSGGTLTISSGGTALDVTENGGFVDVKNGADVQFASNVFYSSRFDNRGITLHSGTTAVGMQIATNCSALIYSSGSAVGITVCQADRAQGGSGSALITVYEGGTVDSAMISRGYASAIISDGLLNNATITHEAVVEVTGGVVSSVAVHNNAQLLQDGGTADDITIGVSVNYGGTATIRGGSAHIAESGGCVHVSGGTVTFIPSVFSGVYYSGGLASGRDQYQSVTLHSGTTGTDLDSVDGNELYYTVFSGGVLSNTRVPVGAAVFISSGASAYGLKESGGYVEVEHVSPGMFAVHTIDTLYLHGQAESGAATFHSGISVGILDVRRPKISAYIYSGASVGSLSVVHATGESWEHPTYAWIYPGAFIGSALVSGVSSDEYESSISPELHLSGAQVTFASATDSGAVYVHSGASVLTALTNNKGVFHIYAGGFVGKAFNPFNPGGADDDSVLSSAGYYRSGGSVGIGNPYEAYYGSGITLLQQGAYFSGMPTDPGYPEMPFQVLSSGYSIFVYAGGTAEDILINAGAEFHISGGTASLRYNPWEPTVVRSLHIASGSEHTDGTTDVYPVYSAGGTLTRHPADPTGIYYGGECSRMYLSGMHTTETISGNSGNTIPSYRNNFISSATSTDRDGVTHTSVIQFGGATESAVHINYSKSIVYSSANLPYSGDVVRSPLRSRVESGSSVGGVWHMSGASMLVYDGGVLSEFQAIGGFTYIYPGGVWSDGSLTHADGTQTVIYTSTDNSVGSCTKSMTAGVAYISGGAVENVTVSDGAKLRVCSNGAASNIVVSGDSTVEGGRSYAYMYVDSGGSAINPVVAWYGLLNASGAVTALTVEGLGSAYLHSGCSITSAAVSRGGLLIVASGVTGSGIDLHASGILGGFVWTQAYTELQAADGAIAIAGATVLGSTLVVSSGSAGNFSVTSPGIAHVRTDGLLHDVSVIEGGSVCVNNAGAVSATVLEGVFSCGLTVSSGGHGSDVVVNKNGFLIVSGGGTATTIYESGGHVEVLPGGNATFASVTLLGYNWSGRGEGAEGPEGSVVMPYRQSATLHSATTLRDGLVSRCYLSAVGGSMYGLTIEDSGDVGMWGEGTVSAYASDVVISEGQLLVSGGASAYEVDVLRNGNLRVSGGVASHVICSDYGENKAGNVVVSSGLIYNLSGIPRSLTVENSGVVSDFSIEMYSSCNPAGVHIEHGGSLCRGSALNGFIVKSNDDFTSVLPFRDGSSQPRPSGDNVLIRNGEYYTFSNGVHYYPYATAPSYADVSVLHAVTADFSVASGALVSDIWLDEGNNITVQSGGTALNVSTLHDTVRSSAGASVTYAAMTFEHMLFLHNDKGIRIHNNTVISSAVMGNGCSAQLSGTIYGIYPLDGTSSSIMSNCIINIYSGGSLYTGSFGSRLLCSYYVSAGGYINGDLGEQAAADVMSGARGGALVISALESSTQSSLVVNGVVDAVSCMSRASAAYTNYISLGGHISGVYAYHNVSVTGTGTVDNFYAAAGVTITSNGVVVPTLPLP